MASSHGVKSPCGSTPSWGASQPLGDSTEDSVPGKCTVLSSSQHDHHHLRRLCFDFCFYTRVGSPRDRIPHVSESSSPFSDASSPHLIPIVYGARLHSPLCEEEPEVESQSIIGFHCNEPLATADYGSLVTTSIYVRVLSTLGPPSAVGWSTGGVVLLMGLLCIYILTRLHNHHHHSPQQQQQHNITMNHRPGIIIREFCWGSVVVNCGRL